MLAAFFLLALSPASLSEASAADSDHAAMFQVGRTKGNQPVCPDIYVGTPKETYVPVPSATCYDDELKLLDLDAVKKDIELLLTDSQRCWPADYGNYGPFFVRLAWHCSGTFRATDGKGGCGGGRQRFAPEADWEDNTNLDKARALLAPIKRKYGAGLSWGDLFVLAGTQAMRSMGAPLTTFCAGRIDDPDGYKSHPLGPGDMQEAVAPCTGQLNGECQKFEKDTALAVTTVGLIYVNPEGPMGVPDPNASATDIRKTFNKMHYGEPDDRNTVALIGGGHAFGKSHGACSSNDYTEPQGYPPLEALEKGVAPWMGKCPLTGMGNATFTSGFEGPWTSTPTQWSNEYFQDLLSVTWEKWQGPGGHIQWRNKNDPSDQRMRLTSDIALISDDSYRKYVEEFANNMSALDEAFDRAWYGLTHNGGSWSESKFCDEFVPAVGARTKQTIAPKGAMLSTDIHPH